MHTDALERDRVLQVISKAFGLTLRGKQRRYVVLVRHAETAWRVVEVCPAFPHEERVHDVISCYHCCMLPAQRNRSKLSVKACSSLPVPSSVDPSVCDRLFKALACSG